MRDVDDVQIFTDHFKQLKEEASVSVKIFGKLEEN